MTQPLLLVRACMGVEAGDQLLKSPAISTWRAWSNGAENTTPSANCLTP